MDKKLFLLFVFCSSLFSEQGVDRIEEALFVEQKTQQREKVKSVAPFVSLSMIPGLGLSWRDREDLSGRAFDVKVSPVTLFSGGRLLGVLSVDYNWIHFYKEGSHSPYTSIGAGAALTVIDGICFPVPYAPLRAGYQFNAGFIDIGGKFVGHIPLPEVRAGFNFHF